MIERVEALGEHPEDPLLLFSVLYGLWIASYVAFNGDLCATLHAQFLAVAEKQGAIVPLMVANRMMGTSLLFTGEMAQGQEHLDRAMALYDPTEHRPLAARFGQDIRVSRSCAFVRRPHGCLAILMPHLQTASKRSPMRVRSAKPVIDVRADDESWIHIHCRNYATADTRAAELGCLAGEKGGRTLERFRNAESEVACWC